MLPRRNRITKDVEYDRAYRIGKKLFSHSFVAYLLLAQTSFFRLGIVASKRNFPKTVQRSMVKRRVRSAMAKLLPSFKKTADCVLVLKKNIFEISPVELGEEIKAVLKKAGISE